MSCPNLSRIRFGDQRSNVKVTQKTTSMFHINSEPKVNPVRQVFIAVEFCYRGLSCLGGGLNSLSAFFLVVDFRHFVIIYHQ